MSVAPLESLGEAQAPVDSAAGYVPHVVAWNLTRRCNLACSHCYISAGPDAPTGGELTTDECLRIADEILALNPAPMFIFSGGEPLMRADLEALAAHCTSRGATVVVGTNGTLLTDERIGTLQAAGVSGVAVSIESLDPTYHDRFRRGHGSLQATVAAIDRLVAHQLDFVIQTTITAGNRDELPSLVAWAAARGAVSFNAYTLVTTGRGSGMKPLPPNAQEALLAQLADLHVEYLGRMMVRAKCAPAFMRLVHRRAPRSPILQYATRCPCGVQYCRIGPDGALTPCPYMPVAAGDLRRHSFAQLWQSAPLFEELRRGTLGGKCGDCGYRAMCGGCRARAFATSGDYLAADESCSYQPDGHEPVITPAHPASYGAANERTMAWTEDALARLDRVPSFVRGVVIARMEGYAREHGHMEVTADLMKEVRRSLPIDFSKRLPFFMRDD
jgi:radical SAM protein with 4Fe4S-binding SPASM domain